MRTGLVLVVAVALVAGCASKSVTPPTDSQMATPIPHAKTITFSYLKFSVTYDASKLRAVQDPENMFDDTRGGFVTIDFVDKSSRYLVI